MNGRELELQLPFHRLAGLRWGADDGSPVLALHGWLDNAASFARLAPMLDGLQVVALDLTGHGRSQHRPAGANHHFVDWVPEVAAAADALGWERFSLLGHSMGAGISTLVSAAYPERVARAALLEGAGPMAAPAEEAAKQLRLALADEQRAAEGAARVFPDLESAVGARARDTDLDHESARLLVIRGTEEVDGGVCFTHDIRLKTRSRVRFTEGQVHALLAAIECPVLALRALQGWPFPQDIVRRRLELITNLRTFEVDGGHHVHLTHPERVAPTVNRFLLD
ncbi:MAG: alpha/beta hydrolase [Holophagae bacterium]